MSESEHPQNARLEASARAICKARIHPGLSPNPMPPCQSCARLAGHALAAADGIPQDTERALIGKQVRVTLSDVEGEKVIATGKLLGFGQGGDCEVLQEDGFVHYCWPMLHVELASGETN